MRHLSSWTNQRTSLLLLGMITVAVCFLSGSDYFTSAAFAQNTISSSKGQTVSGKKYVGSRLASTLTAPQGRTTHRLIRKPTLSQIRAVTPTIAATSTSVSAPLETASPSGTSVRSTSTTPLGNVGTTPLPSSPQHGTLATVSSFSTTSAYAVGPSSASSKTSLSASSLTAAASGGTAPSSGSNGSRTLGRLLSEMPGMTQLLSQPESRTAPPPAPAPPAPSAIGVVPTSLSFTAQQGGGNPASQNLRLSNSGGGSLNWTVSDDAAWLTLSPASGTGNATVTVTALTGALVTGTYNGVLTISATGAASVSVPVTFTISPAATSISVSPTSLTYSGIQGGADPVNQSVTVTSNGSWTASSNASWLSLSPASGSGNGTITTSVNLANATVGTNSATITVTGGGTTRTANVTLTVSSGSLTVAPTGLSFTATQGAANPAIQSVTVTSNGSWTVSDNASWLTISPASGSNNGTITASVNTSTASLGSNTAIVTVTGGGITRTVNVTLTVNAPATSSATLAWGANSESDLAGYNVYRSTASGTYGAPIATLQGNVTSYVATGLQSGTTYFFVVTAYDSAGNESPYSNEVSKSIF